MVTKDVTSYSAGSKFFHWVIAIIVITMLSVSFFLGDFPEAYQPTVYMIHKSFGLTVLFLMILRLIWIVKSDKPALPSTVPVWQKAIARIVQYSLYVFIFGMALSGWVMSVAADKTPVFLGLFKVPLPISPDKSLAKFMNQTHEIFAWIIIALLMFHIVGAIKHYFIDKDQVVQSMLPDQEGELNKIIS